ncbi:MAG: hypothetical protein ABSG22_09320 [Sedimentisphaerales bacterium]|jgi:hypothetical protein
MKKVIHFQSALVIVLLSSLTNQADAVSITSISQNASSVGRFEKFEMTFMLDRNYTNPFDINIVDIMVNIIKPDGNNVAVPAFYYKDYEQDMDGNYINGKNPCWKMRFASNQLGVHIVNQIRIIDQNGSYVTDPNISFKCVESGKKGFIRVDPNNRAFLKYDDGSTCLNIGENVAWNIGRINGWNNYLTKIHKAGGNWVRLWMCRYGTDGGTLLEWKDGTYSGYFEGAGKLSMQIALRLDKYIEIAEQNGINIQLCLQHHGQFSTTSNPDWNDNSYRDTAGGWLNNPAQFFSDAEAIRYTKNKFRYIIARWGYSTSIFAWELFNEVQFTNGWRSNREDVINWHNTMAKFIHSIDPYQHPITTSSHGSGFENLWNLPDIDLVQEHYYGNDTIHIFERTASVLAGFNKPVIIAEFGLGGNSEGKTQPEPMATQLKEGLEMHNGIWASFHVKSSGHMWLWDYYIDPCNLYGVYTPLAVYAANENLADLNLVKAQRVISGAKACFVIPGLNEFLAASTQKEFILQGDDFPGAENLSKWLQGSTQQAIKSDPIFHLNTQIGGTLKIHIVNVSKDGTNKIQVLVDGKVVYDHIQINSKKNYIISVPYPAKTQTLQIKNTGEEWSQISSYEFAPDNMSKLDSIGLVSNNRAYIWIYDVNSQYGIINNGIFHNELIYVKGLDDGRYTVEVYATHGSGGIIATGKADSSSKTLTYTLPDFSKDIAVKVKPAL